MPAPTNAPIEMIRGDSLAIPLTFTDPTAADAGVDVSGYTLRMTVKVSAYLPDSEAALQKVIVLPASAASGEYTILVEPADTNALEPMSYDYDIQLTSPDGNTVITVVTGKLKLLIGTTWES